MRTVDADKLMERAKMHSIMVSTTLGHFDYGMTLGMLNEIVKECETSAPVGDTVSRQTVLNLLSTIPPEEAMTKAMLIQSVKQMDAAQPEWKRGKWIDYANSHCECSVCHTEWSYFQNEVECFEFCPNCGADMREVDDERPD